MQNNGNGYIPGICNLGKKEISRRKYQAIAGLLITIAFVIIVQMYQIETIWKLLIFAPVFYTTICLLQAREQFCVVFGINGVYNFSDERDLIPVNEVEYRVKDRKKAIKILFLSVFIAVVISVIYFYL